MTSTNGVRRFQFVDTNVLVYAHDYSAGDKHSLARELITELWADGIGCLSIRVLQEFFVTVTRKVPVPLSIDAAIEVMQDLSRWHIHCPMANDLVEAAILQKQYKLSYWDVLIVHSANQMNCTTLWSEDFNTGQLYKNVVTRSPFP